jgi:hypothetical protein
MVNLAPTDRQKRFLMAMCVGVMTVAFCGNSLADDEAHPQITHSRGGPLHEDQMDSFTSHTWFQASMIHAQQRREITEKTIAWLQQFVKPLRNDRGDRWPLIIFGGQWSKDRVEHIYIEDSEELWQAWIDRGLSPNWNELGTVTNVRARLPMLHYFQDRGFPIIIHPVGWVNAAFADLPAGTGSEHLPPAKGMGEWAPPWPPRDHSCPAWLYENPALFAHADNVQAVCQFLQDNGIDVKSAWIDFEAGTFLRNGAEEVSRIQAALDEARKCPRCLARFSDEQLRDVVTYSQLVDDARGFAQKVGLTDPVKSVFPNASTGAFYVHPVRREPPTEGKYPAYGWEGSGFTVAQPRCYFTPGWGSPPDRTDEHQVGWNILMYCLDRFSACARVLEPDEIMVPWVGYLWQSVGARRQVSQFNAVLGSRKDYREMAYHVMLRGAESFIIYAPHYFFESQADQYPEYKDMPRVEEGALGPSLLGLHEGYDDMLAFNEILRAGKPLNFDTGDEGANAAVWRDASRTSSVQAQGDAAPVNDGAAVWSGVATDELALVRTVAYSGERVGTIRVFDRPFDLTFRQEGDFYWLKRDGSIERIENVSE